MNRDAGGHDSWKAWAAVTGYVLVACVFLVLPIADRFTSVLLWTSFFPHDSVLNAGILEWGRRAIPSPALSVFEWTGGFPLHNSLAVTENLLGWQPFYMPLRWAGASVACAYNILLIASLVLSAIGASLLARRLGIRGEGAFLAGLIFAFVPFHLNHLLHLQTMAVCWAPFALFSLDRFLDQGKVVDLVGVVAFFVLSVLSGLYVGIFLGLALPVYAIAGFAARRFALQPKRIGALVVGGVVAATVLWPVLSHYLEFSRAHGYRHSLETLTTFSVEILAVLKIPAWVAIWTQSSYPYLSRHGNAFFPGFVALVLFVCGVRAAVSSRDGSRSEDRRTGVLLMLVGSFFYLVSLGPRLQVFEWPTRGAYWIPLPGRIFEWFTAVRSPMRALFLAVLCASLLAGLGFNVIARRWRPRTQLGACVVVALLMIVEFRPAYSFVAGSLAVPDPMDLSTAYPFLASETDHGGVVELPAADATGYRAPMLVKSSYGSAGHLRRVVGFHGQGLPPINRALLEAAEQLPAPGALELLRRYGCSRLVVHRRWLPDSGPIEAKLIQLREAGLPVLWESAEAVVFALN